MGVGGCDMMGWWIGGGGEVELDGRSSGTL